MQKDHPLQEHVRPELGISFGAVARLEALGRDAARDVSEANKVGSTFNVKRWVGVHAHTA